MKEKNVFYGKIGDGFEWDITECSLDDIKDKLKSENQSDIPTLLKEGFILKNGNEVVADDYITALTLLEAIMEEE